MNWTTRDGHSFPIEQMGDDHLANAISVLSGKERKRRLLALRVERLKRLITGRRVSSSPVPPRRPVEIGFGLVGLDGEGGEW